MPDRCVCGPNAPLPEQDCPVHGNQPYDREPYTAEDARTALADALYEVPYGIDKDGRSFLGYWGEVADALVQGLADQGWTLTLTRQEAQHG